MKADKILEDANCGFVGINAELEVCDGYDSEIPGAAATFVQDEWNEHMVFLCSEEKSRLADLMISRWSKYKSSIPQGEDE